MDTSNLTTELENACLPDFPEGLCIHCKHMQAYCILYTLHHHGCVCICLTLTFKEKVTKKNGKHTKTMQIFEWSVQVSSNLTLLSVVSVQLRSNQNTTYIYLP